MLLPRSAFALPIAIFVFAWAGGVGADTSIGNGATFTAASAAAVTAGPITFTGNGTLQFTGSFTLANNVVFNDKVTGTIDTNGQDDVLTGVLSGNGSFAKIGNGTLTLTGNNTFSGGTGLSAGTLAVGSNTALGTGPLTFSGGTLLGATNVALANAISMSGNITFAAAAGTTLDLNNGPRWTLNANTAITFGTPGATGTVLWRTPFGAAINSSTGTSLNVAGGTLKGGDSNFDMLLSNVGSLSVGSGATLDLAGFNARMPSNFSGSGRITSSTGAPTLTTRGGSFAGTIDGGLGVSVTASNLTLTGSAGYTGGTDIATGLTLGFNSSSDSTLSGIVSGAGAVSKQGTGTLTLTGNNTFSGGTSLSAGTLAVSGNAALGTGPLTFSGGTWLGLGNVAPANRFEMSGDITFATGRSAFTVDLNNGQPWSLAANTSITFDAFFAFSRFVWRTPAGSSIAGAGTQSIKLNRGVLAGGDSSFNVLLSNVGSLNVGSGATLDLAGFDVTLPANVSGDGRITSSSGAPALTTRGGSFNGVIDGGLGLNVASGSLTITGSVGHSGRTTIASGQTLAFNSSSDSTLTGDVSGAGSLSKQGTGTLLLTGDNAFSGGTSLSAGTLAVGSRTALGTGPLTFNGGTLLGLTDFVFTGALNIAGAATLGAATGTTLSIAGSWSFPQNTSLTIGFPGAAGTVVWDTRVSAHGSKASTPLTISGGTLRLGPQGSFLFSSAASSVTINKDGILDLGGFSTYISPNFSGSGRITSSSGAPTLMPLGGGAFDGAIDGGLGLFIQFADLTLTGRASYTGATTILGTRTLTFNSKADSVLSGDITGAGNLSNLGTGTLTLTGRNSYTGGTTIGTGGTLVINSNVDSTLAGIVSGAGVLSKQGTGTLTLTGNNTHSGGTSLSAGTLAVGSSTALGTGALTFSGGTLLGTANVALANPIAMSGNITFAAATGTTLDLNNGLPWTMASNTTFTFGSPGAKGTVVWRTPFGSIPYGGPQSMSLVGGTLRAGDANFSSLLSGMESLNVSAGATLDLAGFDVTVPANFSGTGFSGSGKVTSSTGAPTLTMRGGSFDGTIDGGLGLRVLLGNQTLTGVASYAGGTSIGSGLTLTFNSSSDSALSGIVSGAGALSKQGTGTLILTGDNTFSGGTSLSAGTLAVSGNAALGTGPLTFSGGTLLGLGNVALANRVDMSGDITFATGRSAFMDLNSGQPWSLAANTNITFDSRFAFSRFVWRTPAGSSIAGAGTQSIKLNGGVLEGGDSSFNVLLSNVGSLNVGSLATLDLAGFDVTLPANVSGDGRITSSSGAPVLTTRGGSFNGVVYGGLGLNVASGSLTITGSAGYTGRTTIASGQTLAFNSSLDSTLTGDVSGAGSLSKQGIGTLTLSGSNAYTGGTAIGAGGTLVINGSADSALSGIVSGAGALSKQGTGTLILTGDNTFSGGTSLSEGTLAVYGNTALGTGPLIFGGGTLLGRGNVALANRIDMSGNITFAARLGRSPGNPTLDLNNGQPWSLAANTNITFDSPYAFTRFVWRTPAGSSIAGAGTQSINLNRGILAGGDSSFNVLLSNVGSLNVSSGATLDLAGFDVTLPANVSGDGRITSSSGAPVLTTRGGSFNGVIDGGLGLSVTSGSLTITGTAGYTGGTTIQRGRTLTFNSASDSTLSGLVSGVGGLSKQGAGTLTLTGDNTFGGGTSLWGGTLAVGSNTALGTGALFFNGGTLLGTTNVALANPITMSGNITFAAATGTTLDLNNGLPWTMGDTVAITFGAPGATGTVVWRTPGGSINTYSASQSVKLVGGMLKVGDASFTRGFLFLRSLSIGPGATLDLAGFDVGLGPVGQSFSGSSGRITSSSGAPTLWLPPNVRFDGAIDGTLGLSVGYLTLTGSASYTGGTDIGRMLTFNSSADSTLSGIVSGEGALATLGTGTLTLTGNNTFTGGTTIGAGGTLRLGDGVAGGTIGDVANAGRLLLAGGAVSAGTVSQSQAGSQVTVRSGTASLTGSGVTTDDLVVGDQAGGKAALGLAAGKVMTIGAETIGYAGNATFTQTGGTHTATSLVLGATAGSNGTFNLNGGSFTVGSVTLGLGSGTFNFNGGSFSNAGDLRLSQFSIGIGASYSGSTVSIAGALTNLGTLTASSQISVDGNLDNSGVLTLTGGLLGGAGALVNNNLLTGSGTIGGSGGFTNYGQVQTAGGGLTLGNTGANANYGNWDVTAGQPLLLSGATLANFGVMNLNGGLVSGSGKLINGYGGLIAGRGTIVANFSNAGELGLTGGALAVTKAFTNSGLVNLTGTNASLTGAAVTNIGIVQGAGTISSALANAGTVEAVGGTLVLGGAVTNNAGGLMTAGVGNRLIVSQGLATNAGIVQLAGGTFDNNARALSNTGLMSGFGTFRAGSFTNTGRMSFSGGNTVVNGNLTNQAGGRLEIGYNPATFTGNVVNNGFVKTTATSVTWAGSFTNNGTYLSDPSTQVFQDMTLGAGGALQGGVGDVFIVSGNLINNSQAKALFDLSQAKLSFTAGAHTLVWSGMDLGTARTGYDNNFAIGIFELRAGGSLTLAGASALPGANGLYVHSLVLGSGLAQIGAIQSGMNIYYDPLQSSNAYLGGATYVLAGGGRLLAMAAVPEPETYALCLTGLLLIGGIARRRRAAPSGRWPLRAIRRPHSPQPQVPTPRSGRPRRVASAASRTDCPGLWRNPGP